jgi:type IV pilus assembly protein PilW
MKHFKSHQTGFTLVELMIAMLLGAFLIGGILQIFIGSRQTYRMQENLSRLQENGRFAMDFITRDNRMMGFQGCASRSIVPNVIININPNSNPNPVPVTLAGSLSTPLIGSDNVTTNNWNASACDGTCVAGTDAITYHFGGSCGGYLTGNLATNNANIQIPAANSCNINMYDVLMLSDCSSTDIFIATSAPSTISGVQSIAHTMNQNTAVNLSKLYGSDAEVLVFRSYSFFIRNNASGEPGLWRLDNSKAASSTNPVELVEGIEDMQILYGADTDTTPDGTANYYVPAGTAGLDMNEVVSIRVSVLVRSMNDNLAAKPLKYTYNGAEVTPKDRRIRRVFTSTIALRNRLP